MCESLSYSCVRPYALVHTCVCVFVCVRECECECERECVSECVCACVRTYGRMLASVFIAWMSCFQFKQIIYIHNIRGMVLG